MSSRVRDLIAAIAILSWLAFFFHYFAVELLRQSGMSPHVATALALAAITACLPLFVYSRLTLACSLIAVAAIALDEAVVLTTLDAASATMFLALDHIMLVGIVIMTRMKAERQFARKSAYV